MTFQPGTLTVTKRAITFKADDVTRIYGDASPAFSYGVQAGSIVAGDSFGAANFSAAGTTVGTHAITLSGLANANYDVTFQPGTLTVTKRAITFKADDVTRIYGDTSPAFSYGVQAGSIVDGDSFGAANFSAAGTTVGTHAITLSGLANANYDVTFQPGTLTVTKRAITFKADDVTRIYGDASPAFSYAVQAGSIVAGDSFGTANFSAAGTHRRHARDHAQRPGQCELRRDLPARHADGDQARDHVQGGRRDADIRRRVAGLQLCRAVGQYPER